MKSLAVCVVLMILMVLAATPMQAQSPAEPKNATGTETIRKPVTETGRTLGKLESLSGSIAVVNDDAKILTLAGSDGTPYDFKVTRETKITIDGRSATFADLATQLNQGAAIEFVPMSTGNFARTVELHSK